MGLFGNLWPYSNNHELNLDWIIKTVKDLVTNLPSMVKREIDNEVPPLINEALSKTGIKIQKPVLIGDSYLSGFNALNDSENHVNNNWGCGFAKCMGLTYNDIVIIGSRGAGFCAQGGAGEYKNATFSELINNYAANLASTKYGDTKNVDSVVVCGGYNDINFSISEIQQGITNVLNSASAIFPNAAIYILMNPCYRYPGDNIIQALLTYTIDSNRPVYINANSWKWTFCSNSFMWANDTIHPSGIAYDGVIPTDVMGRMIWQWCNGYGVTGGKWDYELEYFNSGADVTNAAKLSVEDGRAYLYINITIDKASTGARGVCRLPRPLWITLTQKHTFTNAYDAEASYPIWISGRDVEVGNLRTRTENTNIEATILLDPAAMSYIKYTV